MSPAALAAPSGTVPSAETAWQDGLTGSQLMRRLLAAGGVKRRAIRSTRSRGGRGSALLQMGIPSDLEDERWVLDVESAATQAGVSTRTIQRWVKQVEANPDGPVRMRQRTLGQVWENLGPSEYARSQGARELAAAETSLTNVRMQRRTAWRKAEMARWREDGWLSPHQVVLFRVPPIGAWQLTTSRADGKPLTSLRRRTLLTPSAVDVPTRFHARILVLRLLQSVDPWRVRLAPMFTTQGHTWAWTDEPDLDPSLWDLAARKVEFDLSR